MEELEEQKAQLMAYLDGEMDAEGRRSFEQVLMQSPELQRELEQFSRLKSVVARVRIPEPKPELWDEWPRRGPEQLFRIIGWVLFVAGAILFGATAEYLLWNASEIHWGLKLGATLLSDMR